MKYTIYTDTHIGSKYALEHDYFKEMMESDDSSTILLGDIIDTACCDKKDVVRNRALMDALVKKCGVRYVFGNHERVGEISSAIYIDGILFTHGDLISNPDKWIKYRNKPQGAGRLKRIWVDIAEDFEWLKEKRKLPDSFIVNAHREAIIHNCHTVVAGHFHPKERIDMTYNGTRIIVLPRGKSELEL